MNAICRHCQCSFEPTAHQAKRKDFLCRPCNLAYFKDYRLRRKLAGNPVKSGQLSKEKKRAYNERYVKDPEVKKRAAELMRKYTADQSLRERHSARWQTNKALKYGRLIRRPCEMCGDKVVEAHHDDYSKPLDVRWLCKGHHVEHHMKERNHFSDAAKDGA